MMTEENKAIYKKLSRQVDESYSKRMQQPRLFNNRLKKMKAFCVENGLDRSKYLFFQEIKIEHTES